MEPYLLVIPATVVVVRYLLLSSDLSLRVPSAFIPLPGNHTFQVNHREADKIAYDVGTLNRHGCALFGYFCRGDCFENTQWKFAIECRRRVLESSVAALLEQDMSSCRRGNRPKSPWFIRRTERKPSYYYHVVCHEAAELHHRHRSKNTRKSSTLVDLAGAEKLSSTHLTSS